MRGTISCFSSSATRNNIRIEIAEGGVRGRESALEASPEGSATLARAPGIDRQDGEPELRAASNGSRLETADEAKARTR